MLDAGFASFELDAGQPDILWNAQLKKLRSPDEATDYRDSKCAKKPKSTIFQNSRFLESKMKIFIDFG